MTGDPFPESSAAADNLPAPTGHPGVDAILEQARDRLALLGVADLPARRSVLEQTHHTLRAILDADDSVEIPGTAGAAGAAGAGPEAAST